jgi:hypothetical protein
MATAAVISLAEARQAFAKTRARQPLHAQLDRGLDGLEAHRPDDSPRLEELTQAVFARRQELTGKMTEALVEPLHVPIVQQRTMGCPDCHRLLPARPAPPRTVHTMVGEVALSRPYFYCPHCQQEFAPLDEALQLSERRPQWDLQQAAARLAAAVPFATAQARFTPRTGLSLSDHTSSPVAGELRHALGVLDVSPTAAETARRVAEMAAGKTWRPVMVLAIDGACGPTRPQAAKGPGGWSPAHAGPTGRGARGRAGGQGLSLLRGGSGTDRAPAELVSGRPG